MVIPFKSKYLEIRHLLKESWAMGWPMILIMFFQFAIGLTDVYVAGFLGTEVLAAVGYVAQLYWTLMIMANGLSVGTVSMVSQAYGAKSSEGVGCITANSLLVGLCVSGVLTVIAQLYPASIVRLAGMPEGIQVIAESFIRVFSLVLVPTYAMIITGGVLRSSGRIHITMINSLVAASVNVVGELVLSFGWGPIPAMGYIGIAWGTAIATTLGMALNLIYVLSGPARVTFRSLTNPLFGCIKNLVKLGVPTALQQTAWNVGTLMVYFLVARLQGGEITALAAMTAGVRIEAIIFLPIFALNMASAVLTGNRLGAGDVAGARSGAKVTALLCFAIIFLPALGIFILAPVISGLLTQDPEVLQEMTRYLPRKHDRHALYGHRGDSFGGPTGSRRHFRHNEDHFHGDVAAENPFDTRGNLHPSDERTGDMVVDDHLHNNHVRYAGEQIQRQCLDKGVCGQDE